MPTSGRGRRQQLDAGPPLDEARGADPHRVLARGAPVRARHAAAAHRAAAAVCHGCQAAAIAEGQAAGGSLPRVHGTLQAQRQQVQALHGGASTHLAVAGCAPGFDITTAQPCHDSSPISTR